MPFAESNEITKLIPSDPGTLLNDDGKHPCAFKNSPDFQKFYDENKKKFLIDTTLPYHIPSQEDVNVFYQELRTRKLGNEKEILTKGDKYFKELYENIEEQLNLWWKSVSNSVYVKRISQMTSMSLVLFGLLDFFD